MAMGFGGWKLAMGMTAAFTFGGLAVAVAEESHVAQALAALSTAQTALSATRDNKGGHPAHALALVQQARAELQAIGQ